MIDRPMPKELQDLLDESRARALEGSKSKVAAKPSQGVTDIKPSKSMKGISHGEGPVFCPSCHKPVAWVKHGSKGGLKITQGKRTVIDMMNTTCYGNAFVLNCPSGHRVNVG